MGVVECHTSFSDFHTKKDSVKYFVKILSKRSENFI